MSYSREGGEITPAETVAILLGARNGERFLKEQLESFRAQSHSQWILHVSDDASTDATRDVIRKFAAEQPNPVLLRDGPASGFCQNFMSLARDPQIKADYYAFSDQDDIWNKDKLECALSFLRKVPAGTPALYCSRTELVDENGYHRGFSPLFRKAPSFRNALVQNIGGGNTMVFNHATKLVLETPDYADVVSHDWWLYQVVTAVGGAVFYDPQPSLKYRQHGSNIVGENNSTRARMQRINKMWQGLMRRWNDKNITALRLIKSRFHPSNVETFENFVAARSCRGPVNRLYYFHKSKVYRQTLAAQCALLFASLFGKI